MKPKKTLDDWLAELVEAAPEDRTLVGIRGIEAGLAFAKVTCRNTACQLDWFTFTGAIAHLRNRPDTAHQLGDLVPMERAR